LKTEERAEARRSIREGRLATNVRFRFRNGALNGKGEPIKIVAQRIKKVSKSKKPSAAQMG
jgi:hypothetical protein